MDVKSARPRGEEFWALVLALALNCPLASVWAAAPKMTFNIPAGTLGKTILEFSDQAQVQTMYVSSSRTVAGAKTRAVVGRFTPAEALARMLEGTGITFEFETPLSVLLRPSRTAARTLAMEAETEEEGPFVAAREVMQAEPLQQVVVTGSLIRGLEDITAPLIRIDSKEKKQAAYGTVQDVLRTLPLTFGGGPSEDFSTTANFNRGSSIDLRGLGARATLVLVNGRRQPVSSIEGNFVDVSSIPWSAVQRIEVLADGGSALYGSDAVAGVVNIIMREDLQGVAETQTRFGNALGGGDETLLSQSFGHHWGGGKALFTYQYAERTALASAERAYAASADKRPLGGSDLRSFLSNPGNILNPATQRPAFAIPTGQDGRSLTVDQLLPGVNLYDRRETSDLLPDSATHSAFLSASQKITERMELFAEGRFGQRRISATERAQEMVLLVPASNPFFVDPFGGSPFVLMAYNFLHDLGPISDTGTTRIYTGTLGMKADLTDRWQAALSGYVGRESMHWVAYNQIDPALLARRLADPDLATAFNPFGSGSNTPAWTLEAIRFVQEARAVSDVKVVNFVADGPLPQIFTGTPKLALGLDHRLEDLGRNLSDSKYERQISAVFAELSVPLAPHMDVSVAARYEIHSDASDTFNPKIGFGWAVNDTLKFRGSWGTSFRTPTLVDLYDRSQDAAGISAVPDPLSESGYSIVIGEQGSNPGLHEERATTWTAGIDLAPKSVPGLTLSVNYYLIDYQDRIFRFPPTVGIAEVLTDEKWSALVTRNPPRAEVERLCNARQFFGSRAECLASTPAALLDFRLRNLLATTVKGVDVQLDQSFQTQYGSFSFALKGSNVLGFQQTITRTTPAVELTGLVLNPSKLRLRATADWYQHGDQAPGWGVNLAIDHLKGSRDYEHPPVTRISPWTTFDMQLSYRTAQGDSWLGNMDLVLNAANVLDEDPPFVNREEGYDLANADPFGRVISLSVRKSW